MNFALRFFILLLLGNCLFLNLTAQSAPEQDCENAIPVCIGIYYQELSYVGEGNVEDEINSSNSCLGSGEKNGVWYVFSINESGDLGFTITPNDLEEDYDWAVYNITDFRCFQIIDTPEMEVSCNYSYVSGITGATGATNQNTAGGGSEDNQNALIPVELGEQYVLYISNFETTDLDGYTLDLTISTAQVSGPIQSVDFTNVSAVQGDTITPICGTESVFVYFDALLDCNLLNPAAFLLENEAGEILEIVATESDCIETGGGLFSQWFELVLANPLSDAGNYNLSLVSNTENPNLIDICGNSISGAESDTLSIDFSVNDLADIFNFYAFPIACANEDNGYIIGNVTSNEYDEDNFTVSWSNGEADLDIYNLSAGDYTVTIGGGNCTYTQTFSLEAPENGIEIEIIDSSPSCENNQTGSFVFSAEGGNGTLSYFLDGNEIQATNIENLAVGNYELSVDDENGCSNEVNFEIAPISLNSPIIIADSLTLCEGESVTIALELEDEYTFNWYNETGNLSNNANFDISEAGWYFVAIENTENCTFTDSLFIMSENCVGSNNANLASEAIRFYPNPFQDFLVLETTNTPQNYQAQLINIEGKLVGNFDSENGAFHINTENLSKGIYFIQLTNSTNGELRSFKVLKW